MSEIRVILADDHAIMREGLALVIGRQPSIKVVGQAGDGRELLELVRRLKPDVVVLDLSMPVLSGVEAARQLKRARSPVRILALTMHEDATYLAELACLGVEGYILKRSASDQLIEAIRTVWAGQSWYDPGLSARVLRKDASPTPLPESEGRELSEREEQVLRLLARGHANKEVADQLNLSVKTVETYRQRIAEKLGLRNRVDLVHYALQRGWLQPDA